MKENTSAEHAIQQEPEKLTMFGFELLRGDLLPELLGKDTPEILYWPESGLPGNIL
ncbi:hypothetical protein RCG23_17970 [Neobacillus sp. PS3-34]|uniref:hypothetical protein n=1 Tax=Neobacillus sp. PS3-34 TaxID=3070678 RepID=UPI0027E0071A|nr:hypothetical protein [Neobacillus sp. PS3-34]WML47343.1 hypothetical protein RCG23_17970 [Neobacillus sp. PS3-34]